MQYYLVLQIKILQMQKTDKFLQLRALLEKFKSQSKNKITRQTEGQIIQILMQTNYFKSEAQTYGIQVLSYYIPLIEAYMLRAGMQIIDSNQEYVIMEGVVKGTKNNGELGNIYLDGMVIDLSLELQKPQQIRQSFASSPEKDAKLIRILRNSTDYKLVRYSQNLSKFQKQRIVKQREMQRIINSDKNLHLCKQKLMKFQFFSNTSSYDINQLVINSKFLFLKKGSTLYEFGDSADRVLFLLTGQVKIDNSVLHNKEKPVEPGKLLLEKYMVHRKQHNSKIVNYVQPGQWIGLQQTLWGQSNFLSQAEVVSHDAQVLLVQDDLFRKKFNQLTNFYKMNKLKGLVETKKKLLEKTMKTKKQQEDELVRQKQKSEVLKKLQERMHQTLIVNQAQNRKNWSLKAKSTQTHVKKRKNIQELKIPKQCYMPDRLVHKVKVFEQKYQSLPKISERFTLFPQEYQKAMVPLQLRHELKMMKEARSPAVSKPQTFKLFRNQKIYEKVIYASLTPRQNINPETERSKSIKRSKASIQFQDSFDIQSQMLDTLGLTSNNSRFRFNQSIFNNFRAPKNKGHKLLQNISKTLQII